MILPSSRRATFVLHLLARQQSSASLLESTSTAAFVTSKRFVSSTKTAAPRHTVQAPNTFRTTTTLLSNCHPRPATLQSVRQFSMVATEDDETENTATMTSLYPQEINLLCSDGLQLAGQRFRSEAPFLEQKHRRILCLHGWMDNCRSFHHLAPALANHFKEGIDLVALDFPGHGKSSHKSKDGSSVVLADLAYYVAEAVHKLGWIQQDGKSNASERAAKPSKDETSNQFTLIGHSMGAAVSCVYAAAFPDQIERLILLEGVGPLARHARDFPNHVRSHVTRRLKGNLDYPPVQKKIYPSLDVAIQTRCRTATQFPGKQWLTVEAAREMVLRGTVPADENGGVSFCHDVRLQWPSLIYLTTDQVEALYQDISCPTALFLAESGWPFKHGPSSNGAATNVDDSRLHRVFELLRPVEHKILPGSHHFHADPDTAPSVAEHVIAFLSKQHQPQNPTKHQ